MGGDPCLSITQQRSDELPAVKAENDRLRAALVEIADGGCTNGWSPPCPPEDRCDPCTARAALDATGAD